MRPPTLLDRELRHPPSPRRAWEREWGRLRDASRATCIFCRIGSIPTTAPPCATSAPRGSRSACQEKRDFADFPTFTRLCFAPPGLHLTIMLAGPPAAVLPKSRTRGDVDAADS